MAVYYKVVAKIQLGDGRFGVRLALNLSMDPWGHPSDVQVLIDQATFDSVAPGDDVTIGLDIVDPRAGKATR
jgi:hypothetical protein